MMQQEQRREEPEDTPTPSSLQVDDPLTSAAFGEVSLPVLENFSYTLTMPALPCHYSGIQQLTHDIMGDKN